MQYSGHHLHSIPTIVGNPIILMLTKISDGFFQLGGWNKKIRFFLVGIVRNSGIFKNWNDLFLNINQGCKPLRLTLI